MAAGAMAFEEPPGCDIRGEIDLPLNPSPDIGMKSDTEFSVSVIASLMALLSAPRS
jgi:hypothetical protein